MSYEPHDYGSEPPSEYDSAAPPPAARTYARQRIQAPAIALIVIGVVNLFLAAAPAFYGLSASMMPLDKLEEAMREQNPKALDDLKSQGLSIANLRDIIVYGSLFLAGVDFLGSLLVILGGIRMLSLKNYGLAIFAAILAALPFFSCSSCCGLGEIIGIWALVILLSSDVRAAFQ